METQQPEPTKVMVNGAAVALLNSMFQSLKSDLADTTEQLQNDIKDTESRLSGQIEQRFRDHEQHHDGIREVMRTKSEGIDGRLESLEKSRQAEYEHDLEMAARWWLPRRIAEFIARNHKALTLVIGAILGFLVGLTGHVTIAV